MRILQLARKDLLQLSRDRRSLLFLLVMPLVFTYFMGFAMGRGMEGEDPRLIVGWIDKDEGPLSQALFTQLDHSQTVRLEVIDSQDSQEAVTRVHEGELAGLVQVPEGFSAAHLAAGAADLDNPSPAMRVQVDVDEASSNGQTVQQVLRGAVVRTLSAAEAARLTVEQIEEQQPYAGEDERQAALIALFNGSVADWQQPALEVQVEAATAPASNGASLGENAYVQSSPGMLVMFAIFGLINTSTLIVLERKSGALQRMRTTAMRRAEIIAGHLLAGLVVVFGQGLLLILVGQFLFGVDYFREILAVLVILLATGLWVASTGLLIGVVAKSDEQVVIIGMVAMMVLSALGGAWFPLDSAGRTFSIIGHLTPTAWAMDGFQNILVRGLGFTSILLPAAVLLGYALLIFGAAVWRFREE